MSEPYRENPFPKPYFKWHTSVIDLREIVTLYKSNTLGFILFRNGYRAEVTLDYHKAVFDAFCVYWGI